MKRHTLIFPALAAFCGLMITPMLRAQAPAAPAAQKLEHLTKELKLTPQQKTQLVPILESEAPKVDAIRGNASLTKMQKMQELKAVHDQNDPQVKSILSPDQYQKLQEIRQKEVETSIKKKLNY
jgi:hypothetical protein